MSSDLVRTMVLLRGEDPTVLTPAKLLDSFGGRVNAGMLIRSIVVRFTKDLNIWVEASPENAPRIMAALLAFGAPLAGVSAADFQAPGAVLQIGVAPHRIDITTHIDGVVFEAACSRSMVDESTASVA